MDNKTESLATINVMEFNQGYFERLFSFKDTEQGKKKAEQKFISLIKKNWLPDAQETKKPLKCDIEACLGNGKYENDDGYEVYLINSEMYDKV